MGYTMAVNKPDAYKAVYPNFSFSKWPAYVRIGYFFTPSNAEREGEAADDRSFTEAVCIMVALANGFKRVYIK